MHSELFFFTFHVFKIYQRMNKPNTQKNIIGSISSFRNLRQYSSTGFFFKSKVIEGSHKRKVFFNFWALFLKKNIHFWGCDIFSYPVVIQSTQSFSGQIHVFNEAFFLLTVRMPMATNLFRVVACWKELSSINMHDISMEGSSGDRSEIKYISLPTEDLWIPNWQTADLM